MLRTASPLALLALTLLACKPDPASGSTRTPKDGASEAALPSELPAFRMLPWGSMLARSPGGPALRLEGSGPGRVVRVLAEQEGWWQIETVAAHELTGLVGKPIEQLEFYHLRFFVPVGVGEPVAEIPRGPEAKVTQREAALAAAQSVGILGVLAEDPPLQAGERTLELTSDWRVDAGARVYWPDGREAGEVTQTHAFAQIERTIASEVGELRCFAFVFGPQLREGGELCFASDAVYEGQPLSSTIASLWGEEEIGAYGMLTAEEFDEAMAYGIEGGVEGGVVGGVISGDLDAIGGLGLVGQGEGGGGGGGYADIGSLDYGSGIGGLGTEAVVEPPPLPEVDVRNFSFTGSNPDVAQRAVESRIRTLAECVAQASVLTGKLEIELRVGDDGKVADLRVKSEHPALERCARDRLARWRFATGAAGIAKFALSWD